MVAAVRGRTVPWSLIPERILYSFLGLELSADSSKQRKSELVSLYDTMAPTTPSSPELPTPPPGDDDLRQLYAQVR